MIEYAECQRSHVAELSTRLREREAEAFAKLGDNPQQKIWKEVGCSLYSYAVLRDGEVAAIFGAKAMPLSSSAYVWLICTDMCEEHPLVFARESRKVFKLLFEKFDSLYGLVVCDFDKSVRWLEWLGCDMMPSFSTGVIAFERKR